MLTAMTLEKCVCPQSHDGLGVEVLAMVLEVVACISCWFPEEEDEFREHRKLKVAGSDNHAAFSESCLLYLKNRSGKTGPNLASLLNDNLRNVSFVSDSPINNKIRGLLPATHNFDVAA